MSSRQKLHGKVATFDDGSKRKAQRSFVLPGESTNQKNSTTRVGVQLTAFLLRFINSWYSYFDSNFTMEFLQGGGVMGEMLRTYNWESHPAGPISFWPTSLLATLSQILRSKYESNRLIVLDWLCFFIGDQI